MSGSVLAAVVIPVVAFVSLAVFLGLVLYADRNPTGKGSDQGSRRSISGGTFRGDPRQQTPHRDDAPQEVPAPDDRTAR
jgi:hypothetical protein